MIKGSFYILLFYFFGIMISKLIGGFIPGSVIGMILLFSALYFRLVKPENVSSVANSITKNMALFFIPAGVGLMAYASFFAKSLYIILFAIGGSTVLTIIAVALTQERFEKKKNLKKQTNESID